MRTVQSALIVLFNVALLAPLGRQSGSAMPDHLEAAFLMGVEEYLKVPYDGGAVFVDEYAGRLTRGGKAVSEEEYWESSSAFEGGWRLRIKYSDSGLIEDVVRHDVFGDPDYTLRLDWVDGRLRSLHREPSSGEGGYEERFEYNSYGSLVSRERRGNGASGSFELNVQYSEDGTPVSATFDADYLPRSPYSFLYSNSGCCFEVHASGAESEAGALVVRKIDASDKLYEYWLGPKGGSVLVRSESFNGSGQLIRRKEFDRQGQCISITEFFPADDSLSPSLGISVLSLRNGEVVRGQWLRNGEDGLPRHLVQYGYAGGLVQEVNYTYTYDEFGNWTQRTGLSSNLDGKAALEIARLDRKILYYGTQDPAD